MRARTCLDKHVLVRWTKFSVQTRRPILIGEPNANQDIAPVELGKVRSVAQSNEIAVSQHDDSGLHPLRLVDGADKIEHSSRAPRIGEVALDTPTNPLRHHRHSISLPASGAGSSRSVPLSPAVVDELRHHRVRQAARRLAAGSAAVDRSPVFCTEIDTPFESRNVARWYMKVPLWPASPGHCTPCATRPHRRCSPRARSSGASPTSWGHSSVQITGDVYAHALEDAKHAAVLAAERAFGL